MSLYNVKEVSDYKVREWLFKSIKDLSPYQKERLIDDEIIRFAPFKFVEERDKVSNVWIRLTIMFYPIVLVILYLSLPLMFLVNGRWGYNSKTISWFTQWSKNLGLK